MSYTQVAPVYLNTVDGVGWCLRFTQTAFRAPVAFPSARAAWDGQKGRHTDLPPKGVAVPIWFDHWGTYSGVYANWGHVAVSLPDGRILSSPMNVKQGGQVFFNSIAELQRAIGGSPTYLGWSEYMNGKQIVSPVNNNTPQTGQKDYDNMARNSGIMWRVTSGGAKPNTYSYANLNLESGFWASFGNGNGAGKLDGKYVNPIATAFDTTSWAEVTESHARVLEAACAAVRAGK